MLTSFAALAARYKVIFFDAYGVLKNSTGILPGAPEVMRWLSQTGKDMYIVTNDASRSPQEMIRGYTHPSWGELIAPSRIISSGLLAKDFLRAKVAQGNVAYLGKPGSAYYIESAGLTAIPLEECEPHHAPRALALLDDEGYDWFSGLNRALNLIRTSNIPVVVANSDLSYPVRQGEVAIAVGGLAMMIERIVGKRFIHCGKPDTMMFSYAFACAHANNDLITKADVLMVGDTLHTDVFGANTFGIDTALVLSGNTAAAAYETQIAATGIQPTYVCESILT